MTASPWEQTPTGYRSTHDPAYELRGHTTTGYTLVNTTTGAETSIMADGGLRLAMDLAEAAIHGGTHGTHDRNMLR